MWTEERYERDAIVRSRLSSMPFRERRGMSKPLRCVLLTILCMASLSSSVSAQSNTSSWVGAYEGTVTIVSGGDAGKGPGSYRLVIDRVDGEKVTGSIRIAMPGATRVLSSPITGVIDGDILRAQQVGGPGTGVFTRDGNMLRGTGYGTATTRVELKRID
jgi:hypothetical protein